MFFPSFIQSISAVQTGSRLIQWSAGKVFATLEFFALITQIRGASCRETRRSGMEPCADPPLIILSPIRSRVSRSGECIGKTPDLSNILEGCPTHFQRTSPQYFRNFRMTPFLQDASIKRCQTRMMLYINANMVCIQDARELDMLVQHLKHTYESTHVVLAGHSTGCQVLL